MIKHSIRALALGLAFVISTSAGAFAAEEFSKTELNSFAEAAQNVISVKQDYSPKIESANSADAEKQLREEANGKIIEGIENSGITVEKYMQIAQAAQNDPALANTINSMLGAPQPN